MKSITELNTASVTNMSSMFYNCNLLTSVSLNTSSVISINTIFYGCKNLKSITMTGGVENLRDYGSMFNMLPKNGTFYYDPAYDYSKIIAQLPAT